MEKADRGEVQRPTGGFPLAGKPFNTIASSTQHPACDFHALLVPAADAGAKSWQGRRCWEMKARTSREGGRLTDTLEHDIPGLQARDKNGRTGSWRGTNTRDDVCQQGCPSHREAFAFMIF